MAVGKSDLRGSGPKRCILVCKADLRRHGLHTHTPHHTQKCVSLLYLYAKIHTHTQQTHTLILVPRQWKYSIVALFYHILRQLSRQKSKKPLTIVKLCDRIPLRLYRVRGDIASLIQPEKSLREELVPLTQRLFLVHKGYFHRKASPLKRSFG